MLIFLSYFKETDCGTVQLTQLQSLFRFFQFFSLCFFVLFCFGGGKDIYYHEMMSQV